MADDLAAIETVSTPNAPSPRRLYARSSYRPSTACCRRRCTKLYAAVRDLVAPVEARVAGNKPGPAKSRQHVAAGENRPGAA